MNKTCRNQDAMFANAGPETVIIPSHNISADCFSMLLVSSEEKSATKPWEGVFAHHKIRTFCLSVAVIH
jgi:hypothetical protein